MKWRLAIILLTLWWFIDKGYAQSGNTVIHKNIVHLEVAGIGGYGSLNYERAFSLPHSFSLSGRIGISTLKLRDFTLHFNLDFLFPVSINGFYGKKHKVHLGFGQLIANSVYANHEDGNSVRTTSFHTHFAIGYRFQKERLVLGISYTPMIEFQEIYKHWGAVTIGFTF